MKEILCFVAIIVLAFGGIIFLIAWASTNNGHYLIHSEGRTIEAIQIENPGTGRIYYKCADGTAGVVGGTFSVESVHAVEAK